MTAALWVLAVVAWLVLGYFTLIVVLWADEDAHHWDWPEGQDGPSRLRSAWLFAIAALLAAVPVAGAAGLAVLVL